MIGFVRPHAAQSGSTLIEVLMATLVVGMVMTAVAAMLSLSIANTARARYRQVATDLAQDGLEFFRRERQRLGFSTFYTNAAVSVNPNNPTVYCINTLPLSIGNLVASYPQGACSSSFTAGGLNQAFFRQVALSRTPSGAANPYVQVIVTVGWSIDSTTATTGPQNVVLTQRLYSL